MHSVFLAWFARFVRLVNIICTKTYQPCTETREEREITCASVNLLLDDRHELKLSDVFEDPRTQRRILEEDVAFLSQKKFV